MKLSNQTKVTIIVCLIGFIFVGYFTAKQYIKVTDCMESSGDGLIEQERCYRNQSNKHEVEDWEQYKRDMKEAEFKHDLYKEAERLQREGR